MRVMQTDVHRYVVNIYVEDVKSLTAIEPFQNIALHVKYGQVRSWIMVDGSNGYMSYAQFQAAIYSNYGIIPEKMRLRSLEKDFYL